MKIGILAFTSLVLLSACFEKQHDPAVPTDGRTGVIKNIQNEVDQSFYFIVQNLFYEAECSVYKNNGEFVYRFPGQFCLFPENGDYIADVNGQLVYYDSTLKPIWKTDVEIHHDMVVDDLRQEIAVVHRHPSEIKLAKKTSDDVVTVYNFKGNVVFEWNSSIYRTSLEKTYGKKLDYVYDPDNQMYYFMKINSVQILPKNTLEKFNLAFREGNLLINDRLNSVFLIVDRNHKIVWSRKMSNRLYESGHSPRLLENGNIIFFKNKVAWETSSNELKKLLKIDAVEKSGDQFHFKNQYCSGDGHVLFYSKIIEFNPLNGQVIWEYTPEKKLTFCASYFGYAQRLVDGHVLVSHISNGGAAFEINRNHEVVWEWVNPLKDKAGHPKLIYKVTKVKKYLVDSLIKKAVLF